MNKLWHHGCSDIIKQCDSTVIFWKPDILSRYFMIKASHHNSVWGLCDSRVDVQFQSFHITLNHIQPLMHIQQISLLFQPHWPPSLLNLNHQHKKPLVMSLHVQYVVPLLSSLSTVYRRHWEWAGMQFFGMRSGTCRQLLGSSAIAPHFQRLKADPRGHF